MSSEAQVEIENGWLRGRRAGGATSFRGIPYAADTGGANRFRAPQPVANWAGVRDASAEGERCPQTEESIVRLPAFAWYGQGAPFGENCCVLNVFTPGLQPGARRPVICYLHGGGYASGGGGGPALDGSTLAVAGDVVVVTINHRLNLFGYTQLAHLEPELFADAAHAGHLDLVAALQWVHRNIAAFGGDPGNVTLAGQSGGGNKIMVLLTMPAARGLFRRAINMSGVSGLQVPGPQATEPYVDALLRTLGIARGQGRRLQELPAATLMQARQAAMRAVRGDGAQPFVDGRHVCASPFTPEGLALHAEVPLMIGVTDTEATLFLGADPRNFHVDGAQLEARVRAQFGLDAQGAQALVAAYRQDGPQRSAADILAYLSSDLLARAPLLRAAAAKADAGRAPVYHYHFDWQVPVEGGVWRSPHTVDIPFAFGTVDRARAMTGDGPGPGRVAANLMAAFAAFARNGDPNNPRMPPWKPYDTATRATMVVDEACRLVHDFHGHDRLASAALPCADPAAVRRGPLFRPMA
ncbi:carboxylesterase/lipase family protein [Pseudorhodoferax sp.]|uniref:carboxylesterase/lipase family protein n=1 Tax=Pseudorhodoferax sp. TaxID=1993553 RepID=UPI0039E39CBF